MSIEKNSYAKGYNAGRGSRIEEVAKLNLEILKLKAKAPNGDDTIEWLLNSSQTLITAASLLIEIREPKIGATPPEESK